MKIIKSFIHFYNKLSNFGKILVFIVFILMLIIFFKSVMPIKEGMTVDSKGENFLFKDGNDIYDDFYVGIYDHLLFNSIKNDFP